MTSGQPLPDRIERLTLLAQSLITNPSWEDLTRLLALRIFDSWACDQVVIYAVQSRGSLVHRASFGIDDPPAVAEISLQQHPELASVLSYGRTTWVVDGGGTDRLLPASLGHRDSGGIVIAPLNRVNIPEFVLIATFTEPPPENPASGPFMSSVVSLLELRLAMSQAPTTRRVASDGSGSPVEFSDRQQRILERIQDGKTNKSIARELGFSESTIRQETLRLYRSLGVNSRTDAVLAARAKGLLQDPSAD